MTKPVISLVDIKTAPADIREAAEKHLAKGYAMTNEKRTLDVYKRQIYAL